MNRDAATMIMPSKACNTESISRLNAKASPSVVKLSKSRFRGMPVCGRYWNLEDSAHHAFEMESDGKIVVGVVWCCRDGVEM